MYIKTDDQYKLPKGFNIHKQSTSHYFITMRIKVDRSIAGNFPINGKSEIYTLQS